MDKISNTRFIEEAQKLYGKTKGIENNSQLGDFYLNLEVLESSIKKRLTTNIKGKSDSELVYLNLKRILDAHYNATRIKFIDLFRGYISCINAESYSGAIIISRAILENTAMLSYLSAELSKKLDKKDYMSFCKLLVNFTVSVWTKDKISVYERTHINDALRYFSATSLSKKNSSSDVFKFYDPLSEFSHPAPTSFMMYGVGTIYKDKIVEEQKQLRPMAPVMSLLAYFLVYPELLVKEIYPNINEGVFDLLSYYKSDIDAHFAVSKGDLDDLMKMINY